MKKQTHPSVAYFSMEVAVKASVKNYAGGLGILAADYLFSLADKGFPAFGVSLMYHGDPTFNPTAFAEKLAEKVYIQIEGRDICVEIWEHKIHGKGRCSIPLYLLCTNCKENNSWDQEICKYLYPSDPYTRLCQEAILGIAGVRALRKLGHKPDFFHMNEGHSALLTLELLKEKQFVDEEVRKITRFTTHTPIAAGHDYFEYPLAKQILGDALPWHIRELAGANTLSMTHLALNLSGKSNSVSERHNQTCREMFEGWHFKNITNGIYLDRWVSPATRTLLNKYLKGWNQDHNTLSRSPKKISNRAIKTTRQKNKKDLTAWINSNPEYLIHNNLEKDDLFDPHTLTIGFARRVVPYKRTTLIFSELDKLREIGYKKIQIVFAGPFHGIENSYDTNILNELKSFARKLRGQIRVCIIPEYDIDIARHLVSGCDVWLNNPIPPREASGTSGMKAALNGGLNLSILDGWWIEGFKINPKAGWAFGECNVSFLHHDDKFDCHGLYETLKEVIELYYENEKEWLNRCKEAISLAGNFAAGRAIDEYQEKMWN